MGQASIIPVYNETLKVWKVSRADQYEKLYRLLVGLYLLCRVQFVPSMQARSLNHCPQQGGTISDFLRILTILGQKDMLGECTTVIVVVVVVDLRVLFGCCGEKAGEQDDLQNSPNCQAGGETYICPSEDTIQRQMSSFICNELRDETGYESLVRTDWSRQLISVNNVMPSNGLPTLTKNKIL